MAAKGKEKIPERTSKAPLEAAPRKSGKRKAPEQALKIKIGKGKDKATKSRQSTAPFKAFLAAIANQPHKRQAIIDMGFGGLLELDMPNNDPIFSARLLSRYSVGSGSLMLRRGREIEIKDIDVHLVYGITLGGLLVDDNKDNDNVDYRLMLEEWREYVGVQRGSPYVSTMATHLADAAVPVTDNWKRTFLVVAVNCCIKSTLNPQPLTSFLSTTIDVNNIPNYNWCKYTIESLLHSAYSWQEDTTRFFAGPLPFLQVCYFDSLQKELHKPPRAFSLLSVWKREIIRSRISYEFRSGLGMGTVLPRIPAPMHGQQDDEQQQQVFFPVCASDHFYVFCLNFTKMTLDILDNKILPENVSIHDKYKDYPAKIVSSHHLSQALTHVFTAFSPTACVQAIAYGRFLVSLGYNMISSPLRPRIVEMSWRTNVNTYDCGIYAMRHMEKYNGEWEANFETGLTADNVRNYLSTYVFIVHTKYTS
ncbi:hypothetical protein BVRB_006370 [Beta vulgaris subsp. vulgaris]|uniref:Ubiquitin-like protease family profile domain-containing protein n=1 Tax=Beta vulgaris subsp. vulgaris TaxID=3555 RepID=A0A0J8B3R8_BETVV|nr:hypothetical protein BVRB_006370 [Beta vulgaris subsp. vulgaris]